MSKDKSRDRVMQTRPAYSPLDDEEAEVEENELGITEEELEAMGSNHSTIIDQGENATLFFGKATE
jgi:hypothetical protein